MARRLSEFRTILVLLILLIELFQGTLGTWQIWAACLLWTTQAKEVEWLIHCGICWRTRRRSEEGITSRLAKYTGCGSESRWGVLGTVWAANLRYDLWIQRRHVQYWLWTLLKSCPMEIVTQTRFVPMQWAREHAQTAPKAARGWGFPYGLSRQWSNSSKVRMLDLLDDVSFEIFQVAVGRRVESKNTSEIVESVTVAQAWAWEDFRSRHGKTSWIAKLTRSYHRTFNSHQSDQTRTVLLTIQDCISWHLFCHPWSKS